MSHSMGTIIRRLRKEKNLTQEDLALQLGVTYQAVSKWENGTGLPDISQIVPLSHIFGVSTDVLFGTAGQNDRLEVQTIIRRAQSLVTRPLSVTGMRQRYEALQEGLKLYPGNPLLLSHCLEAGIALAYPESSVHDPENAKKIYKDCIHYANLVISYSQNTTDVLRAHMIMVLLHAAYGDFAGAKAHIAHFPWRVDLNEHVMYAYYCHLKKDYQTEAESCQYGILYYLDALFNIILNLSRAYELQGRTEDAIQSLQNALALIDTLFGKEDVLPPLHLREKGDLYHELAKLYAKKGQKELSLSYLTKMVTYDTEVYAKMSADMKLNTPLLSGIDHRLYRKPIDRSLLLQDKLADPCFSSLFEEERYQKLLEMAGL